MKLIEAGKVKQVMKDYWKAQVNKALTLTADVNEADKRINIYLEHNHELLKLIDELPTAQPERTCVNCGRTANNGGWYADGGTRCPIEEHYALPKDGYCHLWEKRNVTDDDYPERRPSIQPDTTTHDSIPAETGKNDDDRTSGDCISRQAAIDTIEKHLKWTTIPDYYPGIFEAVRGWLNGLPSIQPEIIRCKDCKHSRFFDPCFYCYEMGGEIIVPENGFCFKAERKINATD